MWVSIKRRRNLIWHANTKANSHFIYQQTDNNHLNWCPSVCMPYSEIICEKSRQLPEVWAAGNRLVSAHTWFVVLSFANEAQQLSDSSFLAALEKRADWLSKLKRKRNCAKEKCTHTFQTWIHLYKGHFFSILKCRCYNVAHPKCAHPHYFKNTTRPLRWLLHSFPQSHIYNCKDISLYICVCVDREREP